MDRPPRARGAAVSRAASRGATALWGTRRTCHACRRRGSSANSSRFRPNHRRHLVRGLAIQETPVVDFHVEGCTKAEEGEEEGAWEDGRGRGEDSSVPALSLWLVSPGIQYTWGRNGGLIQTLPICSHERFPFNPIMCASNKPWNGLYKTIVPF